MEQLFGDHPAVGLFPLRAADRRLYGLAHAHPHLCLCQSVFPLCEAIHCLFLMQAVYQMTQFIVAYPVAKLLEWVLGAHSGIVYRRAELKELISLHSTMGNHGGDLNEDTVHIMAATLDLQVKVVRDAMTTLENVFMLDHDATKLDYDTLEQILRSGHSRVPVYKWIEEEDGVKRKEVVGVFLVKQTIMLDPEGQYRKRCFIFFHTPFSESGIMTDCREVDQTPPPCATSRFIRSPSLTSRSRCSRS
jgi:CBS domain containing-hemolysin-like protein